MATAVADNQGKVLKRANPATIQDKFMVGYQGWFTCPSDGKPIDPGHHGWLHWFNYPIPDGGRPNIDVWPDVSSYNPSELYPAPGLKLKSGEQARLFSSRNAKTVQKHFHWMAEHGVDGAFLQRFAGQCDIEASGEGIRRLRDEVGDRVREAAEKEGRVFAIMYDITGVPANRLFQVLERDWVHLVRNKRILESPNYLKEKGKPVIGIWGFGFAPTQHTPSLLRAVAHFFRSNTPGSAYLFAGVPAHWRTGDGDAASPNPADAITSEIWMENFDAISPWTIGRYRNELEAERWGEGRMKDDWAAVKSWNEKHVNTGIGRKVDYVPVIYPGGSGYNLSEGKWGFNDIKRNGGRFLWQQIFNAKRLGGGGMRTVYGAMWDEYDEGTAFMPIVEHKYQLPQHDHYTFMALDEDGYDVPSDWYMKICGFACEALRGERRVFESFPSKELQDYWGTRPKYEEGHFSPGAIVRGDVGDGASADGSSRSGAAYGVAGGASVGVAGGSSGGGAGGSGSSSAKPEEEGQSYEQWLATQKDEKEDAPPPPYTLEAEEQEAAAATSAPVATSTPAQPPVQPRPQPQVQSSAQASRPTPTSPGPSSIHTSPLGGNTNLPSSTPGGSTYPGQHASHPGSSGQYASHPGSPGQHASHPSSPGNMPGSFPGTPTVISPIGPASPSAHFSGGVRPGASPNPNVHGQNQQVYPPYGQTPQNYGQPSHHQHQPYGPQQQPVPGQSQDPVAALANDFRRYNSVGGQHPAGGSAAPNVSGVRPEQPGSGGRIPATSPPPVHPARPAAANGSGTPQHHHTLPGGYPGPGYPPRPAPAGAPNPPLQARPPSGMGRPQPQPGSNSGYPGQGGQHQYPGHHQPQTHQGYRPPQQTQQAAQWPPAEWGVGSPSRPPATSPPPAGSPQAHGHGYGHTPAPHSGYGGGDGANLSRLNACAASPMHASEGGAPPNPHSSHSASSAGPAPSPSPPTLSARPSRPSTASGHSSGHSPLAPTSTTTPPMPLPPSSGYPGVGLSSFGSKPPASHGHAHGHTPGFPSQPGASTAYAPSTSAHAPPVSTYPGQQSSAASPWLGVGPPQMSRPHSPHSHGSAAFPSAAGRPQPTYPSSPSVGGSSSAYSDSYGPAQGYGTQFPGSVAGGASYGPRPDAYGGPTSPGGYAMQFPHAPSSDGEVSGAAGYFGDGSGPSGGGGGMPLPSPTGGSSSYPGQYGSAAPTSHSSYQPYPETTTMPAPGGNWTPSGPIPPPRPPTSYSSSNKPPSFPMASTMGTSALDFALNTVDKVAGRKTREQLETQVGSLAQSSSKLFNKFTK